MNEVEFDISMGIAIIIIAAILPLPKLQTAWQQIGVCFFRSYVVLLRLFKASTAGTADEHHGYRL
jgi:hypothetical protein